MKKCEFLKDSLEFCGHKIDKDGLHKMKTKTEAVMSAPWPENVSQLRAFLGLVNYYHKFLPNLATKLQALYHLLKKGVQWLWTDEADKAFKTAKRMVTSDQVLAHFQTDVPLKLVCDASPYGIGAVLSHTYPDGMEKPIGFASRTLNSAETNYAQIDREALALVWGIKKFHHYLYGRHFVLETDHKPLTAIFRPDRTVSVTAAARLQRYAVFLSGYDYAIKYRGTEQHANADALSRLPLEGRDGEETHEDLGDCAFIRHLEHLPVTAMTLAQETRCDPTLALVLRYTREGWPTEVPKHMEPYFFRRQELSVEQDCVMWGVRVLVPGSLQSSMLQELQAGHLGIVKMKSLDRSYIWWPGIDQEIEATTKTCDGCQRMKVNQQLVPVHPWEYPEGLWRRIHVDYAGPFESHMFLVVVDAFSKWPEVVVMKDSAALHT